MSVRVRDLEIALVLAREMKAAAERSVDASLRLEQLQEVFGAPQLDQAERARIQTALQMAGLEPHPSLLEADPADAIRFVAAAKAPAAAAAAAGRPGATVVPPPPPDVPPPPAEQPPTFPTVGQFARSKFGRSRRARRAARDDHGGAPARPVPAADDEAGDELAADVTAEYELPVEPEVAATDAEADAELEAEAEMPAAEADAAAQEEGEPEPDPAGEETEAGVAEPEVAEPEVAELEVVEPEVVEPEAEMPAAEVAEPEIEAVDLEAAEPEPELAPAEAEEPVAEHPEPAPAEPEFADHDPEHDHEPLPYAPPPLAYEPPAPEPARAGASVDEVVAALLPAVAIPVVVTSIAGWRFGLPFVALSVIATGWLLGRREPKRGLLATLRESPAAATVLKTTVVVTVLGVLASVLLNSAGKSSTTHTAAPATKPAQPAAASKPPATPASPTRRSHKPHKPKTSTQAQAPTAPPPDPHTAGLVRVPPRSTTTPSTGTGTGPANQPHP
jgi:hypothetical protein